MAIENNEGLRRGSLIVGRLAPRGKRQLFTVTKVTGKHGVEAICDTDRMTVTINLTTNGLHRKDSPWKQVRYQDDLVDEEEFGGALAVRQGW